MAAGVLAVVPSQAGLPLSQTALVHQQQQQQPSPLSQTSPQPSHHSAGPGSHAQARPLQHAPPQAPAGESPRSNSIRRDSSSMRPGSESVRLGSAGLKRASNTVQAACSGRGGGGGGAANSRQHSGGSTPWARLPSPLPHSSAALAASPPASEPCAVSQVNKAACGGALWLCPQGGAGHGWSC